jgi:cyclic pyranopterin phosphate synthase
MKKQLSHTDKSGKAKMVDVSHKPDQVRTATATGFIVLSVETVRLIRDNEIKKGDVLTVAEVAGIQGAKKTGDLIPLCHPLPLSRVDINAELLENGVKVTGMVKCIGPTGVEMEALTGVQVALLTIYDMCKAVDKQMVIGEVKLVEKKKEDPR